MKLFCPYCGSRNDKNDSPTLDDNQILFDCPDCHLGMVMIPMGDPDKTIEECIKMFDDTPLTDSQLGHKQKRKSSRKRKK